MDDEGGEVNRGGQKMVLLVGRRRQSYRWHERKIKHECCRAFKALQGGAAGGVIVNGTLARQETVPTLSAPCRPNQVHAAQST
jgi:hypothetical protein